MVPSSFIVLISAVRKQPSYWNASLRKPWVWFASVSTRENSFHFMSIEHFTIDLVSVLRVNGKFSSFESTEIWPRNKREEESGDNTALSQCSKPLHFLIRLIKIILLLIFAHIIISFSIFKHCMELSNRSTAATMHAERTFICFTPNNLLSEIKLY